jgi:hypothetical protein
VETSIYLDSAPCFNDWINRCGLIEPSPSNRCFTWINNQENKILAKLDRVFVSIDWREKRQNQDPTHYRHIVGSLIYLGVTRSDISYFVNIRSQFVSTPTQIHYSHLLRV